MSNLQANPSHEEEQTTPSSNRVVRSIYLSEDLDSYLVELASQQRRTVSDMLRTIIEDYLQTEAEQLK